ncbi:cistern family PEP-CTERM protein [Novosphingobium sp. 1949]|uniref:Cistern family PEP-CTERM protein n=1 Tax=Novosphingobium organovorum TaxID=2930092 RepID=A0ABT0B9R9_9SPHN|nr:cistern family PEP-CTERM protein [Novosphingobium organovorum]MCJ2181620.1 cistern family PEP-CTERM protein [Novosphingobium organovorum]
MKRFLGILLAMIGAALATPALADAITLDASDVGNSYTLTYDGYKDGTTVDGLTGTITLTLVAVTDTAYTFSYTVTNTTSDPVTGSRISSFSLNTDPTIDTATSTGAFSYTTLDSTYPNGIGTVDVCFKDAATGSCAGGGSGGLTLGESGSGTFTLTFSQAVDSITLSDFYLRYQSITGVDGVTSASGTGTLTSTSSGGTAVPEPSMLVLFAFGVLAILIGQRKSFARRPARRMAFA